MEVSLVPMSCNQRKPWRPPQVDQRRGAKTRSFEPFRDVLEIVRATAGKQKKIPTDQRGDAFDEGRAPYVGILVEDGDVRSVRRCRGDLVE